MKKETIENWKCVLFGHRFYSPVDNFELIVGNKKDFKKDFPYICLRCGVRK